MNYILDIAYILTTVSVLFWVCFKHGASSRFIMAILAVEIAYVFGYSVFNTGNTPYFVSAIAQLIAIFFLSVMPGGGISKIIIMVIYLFMLLSHLFFFIHLPFQARPYLDFLAFMSYSQMVVVLFRPRIERFFRGGHFINGLVGYPIFGSLFRYWVLLSYDGSEKGGEKEWKL
ncbi:MAG: hypothetical protein COA78_21895 [Blastopirellula sp.]|nr:MAG: hypothetical protein COA78_21895 [Blastopirellula sp.]